MRLTSTLFLLLFINVVYSQNYEFFYDDAGNRTVRLVILLSNNTFQSAQSDSENVENQDTISTQIAGIQCLVYPNPTVGMLYVDILEDFEGDIYCQISDDKGQQILTTITNERNIKINFSLYKSGVYIVFLQNKNRNSTLKIIKN
jgi:hypothetical protein